MKFTHQGKSLRSALLIATVALVILGSVALGARLHFGSVTAGLSYLRGNRLFAVEPRLDLGRVPAGEPMNLEFRLANFTGGPVQILGSETSCGCTTLQTMPITIPAGATYSLAVWFKPKPGQSAPVHLKVYTDHAPRPELPLTIVAQATASKP